MAMQRICARFLPSLVTAYANVIKLHATLIPDGEPDHVLYCVKSRWSSVCPYSQ